MKSAPSKAIPLKAMCLTQKLSVSLLVASCLSMSCSRVDRAPNEEPAGIRHFDSPQSAADALYSAVKANSKSEIQKIFGPHADKLVSSGDDVQDKAAVAFFVQRMQEHRAIDPKDKDEFTLIVGSADWPFPVPIVKDNEGFYFDTDAGVEELNNRRVGKNELKTIAVLNEVVPAQQEYLKRVHGPKGERKYAEKFISDPGMQNGLYWKTKPGEKVSPFGPAVQGAFAQGYVKKAEGPTPYFGYVFKMLPGSDSHRFAAIAYPVVWGVSGVMTFVVNQDGVIYEKNLGEKTSELAGQMTTFARDPSWTAVDTSVLNSL